jgi:hypothetical protein
MLSEVNGVEIEAVVEGWLMAVGWLLMSQGSFSLTLRVVPATTAELIRS